jgi:hypothetical protein
MKIFRVYYKMSTPRAERPKKDIVEEVPEDEEDAELDDDGDLEEMMGEDPFANYLVNEEGQNIADIMTSAVKQMEMQNKILIKILAKLKA